MGREDEMNQLQWELALPRGLIWILCDNLPLVRHDMEWEKSTNESQRFFVFDICNLCFTGQLSVDSCYCQNRELPCCNRNISQFKNICTRLALICFASLSSTPAWVTTTIHNTSSNHLPILSIYTARWSTRMTYQSYKNKIQLSGSIHLEGSIWVEKI